MRLPLIKIKQMREQFRDRLDDGNATAISPAVAAGPAAQPRPHRTGSREVLEFEAIAPG
jgi:hypothetical protein